MPRNAREGKYRKIPTYEDDDDFDDDDDFVMNAVRSQQHLMTQQDDSLDALGQSAARLGQISLNINEELTAQNKMIDEMGMELDDAELNLAVVTKKTQELIKKSGGCKYFSIIVCLSIVVVILFLL
eukprot:CAMPEP_0182468652 /NCGR_PEP_ID=MMETSP1319-20130603/15837_1 /TAXON_ID=172717 /ORGANISM="Bolidomonas pacifica, Strain RCC208" /LENGTH=125 /DNA_ID=CAMNT_0024668873 /DNA_START=105 /DNA_END=479 /DNA_ORIENTATION=+